MVEQIEISGRSSLLNYLIFAENLVCADLLSAEDVPVFESSPRKHPEYSIIK